MEKTKLWLDDFRYPPNDEWVWVKNYDEFVEVAPTQSWEHISLDHDLDDWGVLYERDTRTWEQWLSGAFVGGKTGFNVTEWMVDNGIWPTKSLAIHTDYPAGRERMASLISQNGPFDDYYWYERTKESGMVYPVSGYIFFSDFDSDEPDE